MNMPPNTLPHSDQKETIQLQCIARLKYELENNLPLALALQLIQIQTKDKALYTPEQVEEIFIYSFLNGMRLIMRDYLTQSQIFDPVTSKEWIQPNENNPMQKL